MWVNIVKDCEILRWQEALAAGEEKFREFTLSVTSVPLKLGRY